ncbi:MAG: hypothetical protein RLY71_4224, partial [Pseudomonadota bacterium]
MLVPLPRHSELGTALDYLAPAALPPGTLVRVPLGRRVVTGLVWDGALLSGAATAAEAAAPADESDAATRFERKPIAELLDALPPLGAGWCRLLRFAASYYQRSVGELALAVLPPDLRQIDAGQLARRLKRLHKELGLLPAPPVKTARRRKAAVPAATMGAEVEPTAAAPIETADPATPQLPELSEDQARVLAELAAAPPGPVLLWGVTGSGKTEIYLREAERVLAAGRQVLVLVPEINLTPQLEARFRARFPQRRVVAQHSGLTAAQRLQQWLAAHLGHADLVLGTRMAVFASLPRLGLIVV